jgi:LPS-assembly protein
MNGLRFWPLVALGLSLLVAAPAAAQNPFSSCPQDSMRSDDTQIDPIDDPKRPGAMRFTLRGAVHIPCTDAALWADEAIFDTDTRIIRATGNVLFQQAGLHLFAERAEINGHTKVGTFYNASGRARLGDKPEEKSLFGTLEPDVLFEGERIEKAGPSVYRITNGSFTTCMQAEPRWEMSGTNGTITLDRYALLRNVVLRVKSVPLLYLPAIYYPINKEGRATGFLLPSYGASSALGSSISNAFFWAINRSQDATIYHDWYTRSGQGLGTEYRYMMAPGSEGRAKLHVLNAPAVIGGDGTIQREARRSYRIDGAAAHALPRGFRLIGEANFFSDAAAQQLHQDVDVFSRRERFFKGSLTGSLGRYRIHAVFEERDFFSGTSQAQRSGRAPYGGVTLRDAPIAGSVVYAGAWVEGGRVVRQTNLDDPTTDQTLWRFDAAPSVRLPLSRLSWLSATASASWRITRWLESRDPITAEQRPVGVTRQFLETRANVSGPVLSRVFQTPDNGYAERFKHLIEPSVTLQWTSPFNGLGRIIQNDPADYPVITGETRLNYQLTNNLLARMTNGGAIREILRVAIGQTYYTDARAAAFDFNYQSSGREGVVQTGTFSPIRIDVTARPVDRASGTFVMEIDSSAYAVRTMSASGNLHATHIQLNAGWTKRGFIPGVPGFDNPDFASQSLNTGTSLRTRDNRAGGSYHTNYDVRRRALLQQRVVAYYNSQCCGIAFDWQSYGLPLLGIPVDRRWGVSFTLAGIGSFSNPLGSFGGR